MSLALLPAVVALAVGADKRSWTTWIAIFVGASGIALAHPSTVGVLAIIAFSAVGSRVLVLGVHAIREGKVGRGATILTTEVVVVGVVVFVSAFLLSKMGMASFPRPTSSRSEALIGALTLRTMGPYAWSQTAANWVALALLCAGVFAVVKAGKNLWLVFTWAAFVGLTVLAVGPDGTLRSLTALWYKDDLRVRAILTIFVVLLCSIGAAWAAQTLGALTKEPRSRAVSGAVVGTVVVALAVTTDVGHRNLRLTQWVGGGYQPQFMAAPPLADASELEMIRSLDDVLPEDALIVGDPLSGAVLVQALIGRTAFIPLVGDSGLGEDQRLIMSKFSDLALDPQICSMLDRNSAGGDMYLYWDPETGAFLGAVPPAQGFLDVSAVPDLELVAAEGDVRVWRLGACE